MMPLQENTRTDRWMEGQMDGRMEGRTAERQDKQTLFQRTLLATARSQKKSEIS